MLAKRLIDEFLPSFVDILLYWRAQPLEKSFVSADEIAAHGKKEDCKNRGAQEEK